MGWDCPAFSENGGRHSWIRRLFRAAQSTSNSFSPADFLRTWAPDALEHPGRAVCELVLALICLFNIWQMTRRSGWKGSTRSFWILFSSSVLLFSPLNHDNFLWGFQIGFLLPLACVTGCIWVAT